ncbi:phycobiliprotein lyase [Leptolyngbya sp. AN02str]|uniref:phycobiliprotein lyase n=1 Tax=Leptolyngbya sp. AN02str TaxID=3423363 RepID=UPI003D311D96
MLSFQDFFVACNGKWVTERIYHFVLREEVERSHTEFRADRLSAEAKRHMLAASIQGYGPFAHAQVDLTSDEVANGCPGFVVSFDTVSEKGETVSMSLKALFVPDAYVVRQDVVVTPLLPSASVVSEEDGDIVRGYYLRNEGYFDPGAIAGRFTYQPARQTLEMTTFYNRSVAVDQMRFVAPDMRMRTIVTYQRPSAGEVPTVIDLIGFGVERRQ